MKNLNNKTEDKQKIVSIVEIMQGVPKKQRGQFKRELFSRLIQYETRYGEKFPIGGYKLE